MKNAVTAIILLSLSLSQRNTLSKNLWYGISKTEIPTTENRLKVIALAIFLLEFKPALASKDVRGFLFGIDPSCFLALDIFDVKGFILGG